MFMRSLVAITSAAAVMPSMAAASSFDPLSLMNDYNAIVFENASVASETEGSVFVGGDVSFSSYVVNSDNLPNGALGGTLVVGGNVNGQNLTLQNGNAVIGGSLGTTTLVNNGGGTVTTGAAVDVAGVKTALTAFSQGFKDLPTAGVSIGGDSNNGQFSVDPLVELAILNITASALGGFNNLVFNTPNTATVINVSGANIDLSSGFNFNSFAESQNVLFNFYEATDVKLGTFSASVLAPNALVTVLTGRTEGTVVARSLDQRVEIDGPLFDPTDFTVPQPVPLPGAFVFMLSGLAGMAGIRQLRRR